MAPLVSWKRLRESKKELRVRSSVLTNWQNNKRVVLFQVHFSHSLYQSCRMRVLTLFSKSWRSCFGGEVLSDCLSELGNKCICIASFLLSEHFYYPSPPHTLTHLCLPFFFIFFPSWFLSCSPVFLSLLLWSSSLPLWMCRCMATQRSSWPRSTVTPQLWRSS